jgi:hypothetical protein
MRHREYRIEVARSSAICALIVAFVIGALVGYTLTHFPLQVILREAKLIGGWYLVLSALAATWVVFFGWNRAMSRRPVHG